MTREQKKAKRLERKQRREERKARRKEQRAQKKAQRRANRRQHGSKFVNLIATGFDKALTGEVQKIQQEREPQRQALEAEPSVQKILGQYAVSKVGSIMAKSKIPFISNMVDTVPDVVNSFKQQMRVAYDVSMANGYKGQVNKELYLTVLIDSVSKKFEGLAKVDANQVTVKENIADTKPIIMKSLAGAMAGRMLRSIAFRWVPGVGALANNMLNKQAMEKTAYSADDMFKKDIVFTDNLAGATGTSDGTEAVQDDEEYDIAKIRTIINLMKVDGEVSAKEQAVFKEMLKHADLDEDDKEELEDLLEDEEQLEVNLSPFKANHEDALAFMIDLIALSKADSNFNAAEKQYIQKAAQELGITSAELNTLLGA